MATISVFGIGKVGITLIASLLKSNYKVIGVDTNKDLVKKINEKDVCFEEPGVQTLISNNYNNFSATTDVSKAIIESDISFIIVPTNSNKQGGFSNKYILEAVKEIAKSLKTKDSFHTISIVSTTVPGSSVFEIIPLLEQISGKKVGESVGFCYNPSFIAQGEILQGIVAPDYVLIGESCKESGDIIEKVHKTVVENNAPVVRMNVTEAEITKLASNTHETMRVSFANMVSQICHEMPETNVDKVTQALSFRVGKRFFKGAVPYGGPCWPRDNIALSAMLKAIKLNGLIPDSVDSFNDLHGDYLIKILKNKIKNTDSTIGIIGLAYKSGTPLIDKAFSIKIVENLESKVKKIVGYDPLANNNFKSYFKSDKVEIANNPNLCLSQNICLILQPIKNIEKLNFAANQDVIVIDFWRLLPKDITKNIKNYVGYGVSSKSNESYAYGDEILKLTN